MAFTKRTQSPFRADFVGSFLRPAELKNARALHKQGLLDDAGLRKVEDKCIEDLVKKQVAHGLKAITDGEFRRSWWHLDFFWGFEGVKAAPCKDGYKFVGTETRAENAVIVGKVDGKNHPFVEDFKFLKKLENIAPGIVARQTLPSPAQFLMTLLDPWKRSPDYNWQDYYSSVNELIDVVGVNYRKVYQDLYAAGCRSIQEDDCTWPILCDVDYVKRFNINVKELADLLLAANNEGYKDKPSDLVITTHLCRGNYRSFFASTGGYDAISDWVFAREKVDAWYLEYDDDRSGTFECLQKVPRDKHVVLGIITSKHPELEDLDFLKKRVEEASKYVPLDNLCVSPQCGFASTEEGNELTEEQQWAKIDLTVKLAKEIWGE